MMGKEAVVYGGLEVRSYPVEELVLEDRADGVPMLRGLAVPYGKTSVDLGGFKEVIAPDAARADIEGGKPIAMLWQHDPSHPISKTTARVSPLVLTNTPKGVTFEQEARSLTPEQRMRIEDGVVDQMSFGFRIMRKEDETWTELTGGRFLRTVLRMALAEISPVTFAAYRQTKVAVRCAGAHGVCLRESGEVVEDAVASHLRQQERRLELALLGEPM